MGRVYSDPSEAVNTAATFTVRGQEGTKVTVRWVAQSYNAAPTGGNLTVVGKQSNWSINLDITAAGPNFFGFPVSGAEFQEGEDVVFTLAPAGAAVTGKLVACIDWVPVG